MQNARFEGRKVACDEESGLTLPPISRVSAMFGITSTNLFSNELVKYFFEFGGLDDEDPFISKLNINPAWQQWPKVVNRMEGNTFIKTPMQDMTPRIDDLEELMRWGDD